jgi:hypothetical protein
LVPLNYIIIFSPKIHETRAKFRDKKTILLKTSQVMFKLDPTSSFVLTVKLLEIIPLSQPQVWRIEDLRWCWIWQILKSMSCLCIRNLPFGMFPINVFVRGRAAAIIIAFIDSSLWQISWSGMPLMSNSCH